MRKTMRKTLLIFTLTVSSFLFSEATNRQITREVTAKIVQTQTGDNFAFSPACVSPNILSILLGSSGQTRTQIERALDISYDETNFDKLNANSLLLKSLNGVSTTHSIWVDKDCDLLPLFSDTLSNLFQTAVSHIDFSKPSKASKKINRFISKHTNEKITNMLTNTDIQASDKLLIASAIHLDLEFRKPFQKAYTKNSTFYSKENTTIPMMNQKGTFQFKNDQGLIICSLPLVCEQGNLALLLFLPTKRTEKPLQFLFHKVKNLENGLFSLLSNLTLHKMHLRVPKFSFESKIYIDNSLKRLGITDAYSMHADFSNITTDMKLSLSKNIQSNLVSINEQGVSSSSAAISSFAFKCGREIFHPMHFNRPFAFAIVEQTSKQILTLGQYTNPTKDTSLIYD